MSIRRQIFRSYMVLIVLVILYLGCAFLLRSFQLRLERDETEVLQARSRWAAMIVLMNETVSNWDDGATYTQFVTQATHFEEKIASLAAVASENRWYRRGIDRYIGNLYAVWKIARVNVRYIAAVRQSPGFLHAERQLVQHPGPQRLYHAYMRAVAETAEDRVAATEALRDYIDGVEFFRIYSATVDYLFPFVQHRMESSYARLRTVQTVLNVAFLFLFLLGFVTVSGHFTASLSRPIMRLSGKLTEFIGRTTQVIQRDDEMTALETAVDELIAHYTHLSQLARGLSIGHIETSLLSLPKQGIVGSALQEVAAYLKELAEAASWIRDGRYGATVREKSEYDVLARSFNIMSGVIAEKIATLTGMFETIDEGVILTDADGELLEANHRVLTMLGVDSIASLRRYDIFTLLGVAEAAPGDRMQAGAAVHNHYGEIRTCTGEKLPVKINVRPLTRRTQRSNGMMILVSNESLRVRMRREREKLEAQAAQAELRALRAQINPHFLFNTLNTIAHFVEVDTSTAVGVVEKLAGMFRYALLSTKRSTVLLHEEIFHIQEFLAIEHIRHGSRLLVDYSIAREAKNYAVPPMLLQPIVENSVKYGADADGNIQITVRALINDDGLLVEVTDCGGDDVAVGELLRSNRTGLRNVDQRLFTLYRTHLEFRRPDGGGLAVRIRIPDEGGSL